MVSDDVDVVNTEQAVMEVVVPPMHKTEEKTMVQVSKLSRRWIHHDPALMLVRNLLRIHELLPNS